MRKEFKYLLFVLYGLFVYLTLFNHIGKQPIKIWDESLFAGRAIYMADNNAYMPNFNKLDKVLPNHRNTKLPFTTFIQAASFKVFGVGEKSLRIPLGIILVLSFLYVIHFSRREFEEPLYGVLMSIILLTSIGFMRDHMARFGDQDIPFAAYSLLSILFFYLYVEQDKLKDLALFTFFSIAALLTKNLLSLILIPGLFLYAAYRGVFFKLLKRSSTYVAIFALVASYVATVVYLENAYPGFFYRMWDYELFGRYNNTIEGHSGGFFFYFELYFSHHHAPWFIFIWTIPFIFLNKNNSKKNKNFAVCLLLSFLSYFIIVSMSSTKTAWYYAPLYMINAYLMSMGLVNFYRMLVRHFNHSKVLKLLLISLLGMAIGYGTYFIMKKVAYLPDSDVKDEQYGHFIKQLAYSHPEIKEFSIIDNNFGSVAVFYARKYKKEGYDIAVKRGGDREKGELVMVCLNNALNPIKRRYKITELDAYKYCKFLRIGEEK